MTNDKQNVASTTSHAAQTAGSPIGWIAVVVACVITSMASIAVSMWLMRDVGNVITSERQQFAFIDTQRIIDAKALELASRRMPETDGAAEGERFAVRLKSIVSDYHAKGYTVLNGAILLVDSDVNDFTLKVARELEVNLDMKVLSDGPDAAQ